MERRITEEQLTKALLLWLEAHGWIIICFDFPQSGTGIALHRNKQSGSSKNKGSFIPDIVAIKNETVLFFENKDKFALSDLIKVQHLRENKDYSQSISRLLTGIKYSKTLFGVSLVHSECAEKKVQLHLGKLDFVVFLHADTTFQILHGPKELFA
jgi:Holliday junction resolvase